MTFRQSMLFAFTFISSLSAFASLQDNYVFVEGGRLDIRETSYGSPKYIYADTLEISRTEMTQLEWFAVMKSNPSEFKNKIHCTTSHQVIDGVELCPNHPVENVSWADVHGYYVNPQNSYDKLIPQQYKKLKATEKAAYVYQKGFLEYKNESQNEYTYRVPTFDEWQYVARAGKETYSNSVYIVPIDIVPKDEITSKYAWYSVNSGNQTHEVGLLRNTGNAMLDMSGNVQEMTADLNLHDEYVPLKEQLWYLLPPGGSWKREFKYMDLSWVNGNGPFQRSSELGLRLIRTER